MQSTNKKICIVSISLAKGGAERSCAMLTRMLENLGHEVHLVLLNDLIDYPFAGTVFNLGKFKTDKDSFFKRWKRLGRLQSYLNEHQFDVIIDHRPKNNYRREVVYHRKVYRNQKLIYVTHSSKASEYLTASPRRFVQIANRNVANVAVSKHIEEEVLKSAGVEHTVTIHNAYDPSWKNQISEVPKILQSKKYILAYGRLVDEIKDFSFLMEAYKQSVLPQKKVHLVIMGAGPDEAALQEKAKQYKSSEQIIFLPFTEHPFSIIKEAQFVTLTSKYEGFPMVLVESLSMGTPVVSLDIVSGPSEIIQDGFNGLLVRERNLPLFVEAMNRMIADSTLYQHCKTNAAASVASYSMQEIAKKWQTLLDEID